MFCKLYTRTKGVCDLDMCEALICHEGKPAVDFPGGASGSESACNAGDSGSIPGLGRPSGEKNGYPRILARRIPWKEEPGGLQSIGLQILGHD